MAIFTYKGWKHTISSLLDKCCNTIQPVNCPDIAEPQEILTSDNLSHLAADKYNVTPGTTVNVRCLSNQSHKLIGVQSLTCLDSGQWNHPLPKCVPNSWNDNVQFITPLTNLTMNTPNFDFERVPLIVGISLLCFSCVSIAVLLIYLIHTRRKRSTEIKKKRIRSQFVFYNSHIASTAETLTADSDEHNKFRAFDTDATHHAPSISYSVPLMPYHDSFYSGRMTGSL
ncbi:hypothetical protein ACJMK2_025129 [Sinanodonta woodiana]|uniref:Sushi domain-containing protein n=1 Tax=Sinanodonta woodiana TaxID=1069815 RepID=A0ABD3XH24_SINWO